jgi:hypothetical protein
VRAAAVLAVALVAAGCGGGEDASYSLDATAACLREAGAVVNVARAGGEVDVDVVADAATGGGLAAQLGGLELHLAFAGDAAEAEAFVDGYDLQELEDSGGVLRREENVVVAWCCFAEPSERQERVVRDCLERSAG